jgi:hypothetical protein
MMGRYSSPGNSVGDEGHSLTACREGMRAGRLEKPGAVGVARMDALGQLRHPPGLFQPARHQPRHPLPLLGAWGCCATADALAAGMWFVTAHILTNRQFLSRVLSGSLTMA